MPTALRQCSILTKYAILLWLACLIPAWLVAGPSGLAGLSAAVLLCLVPGWLVFILLGQSSPSVRQVAGPILGSVLRTAIALMGGFLLAWNFPEFRLASFFAWLAISYPILLAVETRLILKTDLSAGLSSPARKKNVETNVSHAQPIVGPIGLGQYK